MIKLSVLYPSANGIEFDYDYYYNTHVSLVKEKAGHVIKSLTIDYGLSGASPDLPAPFHAVANILFDSLESFAAGFAPHIPEFISDVPNYYDAEPIVQISEVKEF